MVSTNPSRLLGYIEVAGPAAQVVLANANGILCKGCGFINTPRATLTTGRAVFGPDGSATGYAVDGGAITVGGKGLDASGARLDLFTRALNINAGIWADRIEASAGAGNVAAGGPDDPIVVTARRGAVETAPAFAIDVGGLGGMYARSIRLIGTEAGLGVNVDGTLATLEQGFALTADGQIRIGGTVTANTVAALKTTGSVDVVGQLYAAGAVSVTSGGLTGSGLLASGGDVAVASGHIDTNGILAAGLGRDGRIGQSGSLTLTSTGLLSLGGQILALDSLALSGEAIVIDGRVQGDRLTASAHRIDVSGEARSASVLDLTARDSLINRGILSGSSVAISAGTLDNSYGLVGADTGLEARGGAVVNTGGVFQSAGALTLAGGSLANTKGAIQALGTETLRLDLAGAITGTDGLIGGNGDVRLAASDLGLDGARASVTAASALEVAVASDVRLTNGALVAGGGALNLVAGRNVTVVDGAIEAGDALAIGAANLSIDIDGALAGGRITGTVAQDLVNAGTILAGHGEGTASLSAGGTFANGGSVQSNSTNLVIRAGSLTNTGDITHAGAGTATAKIDGSLISSGIIAGNGALTISAASLDNAGTLYSGKDQSLRVAGALSTKGQIRSGGSLLVDGGSFLAQSGSLQAETALTLSAGTIDLGDTELLALGSGPLTLSSRGALAGGSLRIGGNGDVSLAAASISLGRSEMTALGALDLRATNQDIFVGTGSLFVSAGDLSVIVAGSLQAIGSDFISERTARLAAHAIELDDGSVKADNIILNSSVLSLRRSRISQTGDGDFALTTSGVLDYSGGEIFAGGRNFTLSASTIIGRQGAILHGGAGLMSLTSAGAIDNSAGQIATNGTLRLTGSRLDSAKGQMTVASGATIDILGDLANDGGFIASGNGLVLNAGAVSNSGGAIETTGRLDARLGSLSGSNGSLLATGAGANLVLDVAGAVSASAGLIGSTGDVTATATSFSLDGETRLTAGGALAVRARSADLALGGATVDGASITMAADNGTLSSGTGGLLLTPGALVLSAHVIDLSDGAAQGGSVTLDTGSFFNRGGTLQSLGWLTGKVGEVFDNAGGEVFATGGVTLTAGSLANRGGRVTHSGAGVLSLQVTDQVDNSVAGLIATNGTLDVSAASLRNDGGQISAAQGANITVSGALSNLAGVVQSDRNLALIAGSLANDAGTIDSLASLTLRADAVDNASGSIVARGGSGLTITGLSGRAATLANGTGTIGSQGALTFNAATLSNQGSILGEAISLDVGSLVNGGSVYGSDVRLAGTSLINTGGEIGSDGALAIAVTDLDNRSGQIVSGAGGLTFSGTTLLNDRGTLGGDGDVTLIGTTIDNGQGTIAAGRDLAVASATFTNAVDGVVWADRDASLSTSGPLTNRGSIASERELVADAALLDNEAGTFAAGEHLSLGFINAVLGDLVTGRDLTLRPTSDFIYEGPDRAVTGLLTVKAGHDFINRGHLEGGTGVLILAGGNLTNEAAGTIAGNVVWLDASADLLNRGLINAGEVTLNAENLANHARIYGDTVGLNGARSILNEGKDAIIATRSGLLALQSAGAIENLGGAWIYSSGDLYIGGLGSSGSVASLVNGSSTIQAQGSIEIVAGSIVNERTSLAWETEVIESKTITGDEVPLNPDDPPNSENPFLDVVLTDASAQVSITESVITTDSGKASIVAGGDIVAYADKFLNRYSSVVAGGKFVFNDGQVYSTTDDVVRDGFENIGLVGKRITTIKPSWSYLVCIESCPGSDPVAVPVQGKEIVTSEKFALAPGVVSAGDIVDINSRSFDNLELGAHAGTAADYAARSRDVNRGNIGTANAAAPVTGGLELSIDAIGGTTNIARVEGTDSAFVTPIVSGVPLTPAQAQPFGFSLAALTGQSIVVGGFPVLSLGGLFGYADPSANYLVETDPAFTNREDFLSSDYFLDRLGYDPSRVQRRMGDALFEQQLISNQLVASAGVGRLAGHADNEAQYRALMDAGAVYIKEFDLALGVGLTAEQMATLTSDMVLLVEVTVQTPSGPQTVLTPRVYLSQVSARDMNSAGAIIAGTDVVLRAADTLTNTGVVRASTSALVLGNDILNTGRLDLGADGLVSATNDLTNGAGTITGGDFTLAAGRDLNLEAAASRTATTWTTYGGVSRSTVSTVHQGGSVQASGNARLIAGRDVNLEATTFSADGDALLRAGRDVNVSAAADGVDTQSAFRTSKKNYGASESQSVTHAGSRLAVGGNLGVVSGRAITITGSDVSAGGDIGLVADERITIQSALDTTGSDAAGRQGKTRYSTSSESRTNVLSGITAGGDLAISTSGALTVRGGEVVASGALTAHAGTIRIEGVTDSARLVSDQVTKKSGMLSSTKTTTHYEGTDQEVVSSTLSGDTVRLRSTGDTTILGSNVVGTGHVSVVAGGTLTVGAVAAQDHEAQSARVKKSGLSVGGGGLFLGAANNRNESTVDSVTHKGSLVGSATGNATLVADGVLTVSGSQVVSPGKTTLAGERVIIEHVTDTVDTTNASKSSSFGLSITPYENVSGAVNSAAGLPRRISDGAAGGAAQSVLTAGSEALQTVDRVLGAVTNAAGVLASIGFSKSQSTTETDSELVSGSTISGGNVNLIADSDIKVIGSDVAASNDLFVDAGRDLIVESAANRFASESHSSSSGASLGVSVGVGLAGGVTSSVSAGFSNSKGQSASEIETQRNATLSAGGTLSLSSGRDTVLSGALAQGHDVNVLVGGDLTVESRQDTSSYDSSSRGISAGLSLGSAQSGPNNASGAAYTTQLGGSLGASGSRGSGSAAVVTGQTGLIAHGGSLNAHVAGTTTVNGGVIAALDEAGKDSGRLTLDTGKLVVTDIADSAKNTDISVGVSVNVNDPAERSLAGANSPVIDGSYASSTFEQETRGTIGQGSITVAASEESNPLDAINRDVTQAQFVTKDEQSGFTVYASESAAREVAALVSSEKDSVTIGVAEQLGRNPLGAVDDVIAEAASLSDDQRKSGAFETLVDRVDSLLPSYEARQREDIIEDARLKIIEGGFSEEQADAAVAAMEESGLFAAAAELNAVLTRDGNQFELSPERKDKVKQAFEKYAAVGDDSPNAQAALRNRLEEISAEEIVVTAQRLSKDGRTASLAVDVLEKTGSAYNNAPDWVKDAVGLGSTALGGIGGIVKSTVGEVTGINGLIEKGKEHVVVGGDALLRDDGFGQVFGENQYKSGDNPTYNQTTGIDLIGSTVLSAVLGGVTNKGSEGRPTWRQSERDVLEETGGAGQQSFKDQNSVSGGTKGSVKIDCAVGNCAIEVKNYDLSRPGGQSSLVREAGKSINKQADHIPEGMDQKLSIDIRGQVVTEAQKEAIVDGVIHRTNGRLSPADIRFVD